MTDPIKAHARAAGAPLSVGSRTHRVMTQARRWFEFYESPAPSIDNQLEILARNVSVESSLGSSVGHAEYCERIAKIPKHWKNSHHLRGWTIRDAPDGAMRLEMDVVYQNIGRESDGKVTVQRLQYTTTLAEYGHSLLPRFTQIKIEPSWHRVPPGFAEYRDVYRENRAHAAAHYWFALIECYDGNSAPFGELFATDFVYELDGVTTKSAAQFQEWLAAEANRVMKGKHHIEQFEFTPIHDDEWYVTMTVYWSGYLHGDSDVEYAVRTEHQWRIVNAVGDRFARVANVQTSVIHALAPVPAPDEAV